MSRCCSLPVLVDTVDRQHAAEDDRLGRACLLAGGLQALERLEFAVVPSAIQVRDSPIKSLLAFGRGRLCFSVESLRSLLEPHDHLLDLDPRAL